MLGDKSDASWESMGRIDPYYGVLSAEKFRSPNLNAQVKREFFESGRQHMSALLERVEAKLGPVARSGALDFGCGVGRLALPLASELGFAHVTGMDVSPSMLSEAARNASEQGVVNVDFVSSDDHLSQLSRTYDFVHSLIVLQHIPADRGLRLIERLVGALSPNGLAALHMPIHRRTGLARTGIRYLRTKIRPLHVMANVVQGRPWAEPMMQMNLYDLNTLFAAIREQGVRELSVEILDEETHTSVYLFIRH